MKTLCSSPVSFAGVYKSKPSRLQDPDPNFFYKNSTRYWVTNGPDVDNKDKDEFRKAQQACEDTDYQSWAAVLKLTSLKEKLVEKAL